jgi:hypothetical protein
MLWQCFLNDTSTVCKAARVWSWALTSRLVPRSRAHGCVTPPPPSTSLWSSAVVFKPLFVKRPPRCSFYWAVCLVLSLILGTVCALGRRVKVVMETNVCKLGVVRCLPSLSRGLVPLLPLALLATQPFIFKVSITVILLTNAVWYQLGIARQLRISCTVHRQ